ncbi:hypothetical protein QAD02_024336 [Eretmocerus hayati]|uniref:Uncharacterized protein n=1 Tax=Eretmocerus hayati TaxID=131215 RepID=A0ACC2Q0L6_9HYME|nr:hypothetical protein QAD02_024336 [Eretmocerus hayati]
MESKIMDDLCGSTFWDSKITWNTDDPDFTECFEETILLWIPCAFLWILAPFEFYKFRKSKSRDIPQTCLSITKVFLTLILIILSISNLIESISSQWSGNIVYNVDYITPGTRMITFSLALILLIYGKKNGLRTSGLLWTFWLLISISGAIHFRSLLRKYFSEDFQIHFEWVTKVAYFPITVALFILNFFVDAEPKFSEFKVGDRPSPERSSSFASHLTYNWFTHLAWTGFKRPLTFSDLWTVDPEIAAREVVSDFDKYWLKKEEPNNRLQEIAGPSKLSGEVRFTTRKDDKTASVFPPLAKALGPTFLMGAFLKLMSDILMFLNPQILELLIDFTKNEDEPAWKGYFYASLMLIVTSLQTLDLNQYFNYMALVGLRIRTILMEIIYRKALRISSSARKDFTVGEIVNLMAVDAQRFMNVTPTINMLWSAPLQISLALFFLWRILGPAVLVGVAIMAILIPLNGFLATKSRSLQLAQMKYKDERVKLMNEVLNGIKVLKLYAWEPSFEKQILKIREQEIKNLKKSAYFDATFSFVWSSAPFLVCFATFATYVLIDENNVLDSKTAFVSLSLFNILRFPMTLLPILVTSLIQVSVSTKRINKFMNSDELDPGNVCRDSANANVVEIQNGSFTWESSAERPTLNDISVQIRRGQLVAVVGSVGSGKSSLIAALLGEMDRLNGRVNVKGSTAYVPQQAWIQNATLRDNILFGKPMDQTLYQRIIQACALTQDFEMLPAGDSTEIGEKGINLSGGQKQRVSLARAVYSNSDVYLLDDPLSAVDSHVGKHIFENLIGPQGMLKDKTRVLVTHGISHLPQVDCIYVLQDGEVTESGTYRKLLEKRGAFAEFLSQHQQDEYAEDDDNVGDIQVGSEDTMTSLGSDGRLSRSVSKVSKTTSRSGSLNDRKSLNGSFSRNKSLNFQKSSDYSDKNNDGSQNRTQIKTGEKLIEIEQAETGKVEWDVYIYYAKSIGWIFTIATVAMCILSQLCSVSSNIWLNIWSSSNDKLSNETSASSSDGVYLSVYAALGFGQGFATCLTSLLLATGCVSGSKMIFELLIRNVLRSPMSFFDTTPSGRILNRLGKDIDTIDNLLPINLRQWVICIFSVIGTISVISYSTPIFMTVIVPLGILYYLVQQFYVATSRQLKRLDSVSRSPIYSHFSESITGAPIIRAYGAEERFLVESEKKIDSNQMCFYPSNIANRWLAVRLETMGNILVFFAALFAVLARGTINAGLVGLSVSYALQITQTLNWIVRMTSEVETNIVAVERLKEYTETPQEAAWDVPENDPPSEWPQNGRVEFRDLKIRYREGLELVLKGLNLSVMEGEKVGIVGRTGAGKSSLTIALFRIVEAAGGQILIDDVDISTLGLHALRSRLTIIPQDPVLFSGSLRINLDPSEKYSDDDLWTALANAHLKDFVTSLPNGLSFQISEGGENLSVGQKQLICLARALLRKTKVLILDEATAAVDLETDDLIQKTIREEFKDCTVLTIAHRLNTILDSDR